MGRHNFPSEGSVFASSLNGLVILKVAGGGNSPSGYLEFGSSSNDLAIWEASEADTPPVVAEAVSFYFVSHYRRRSKTF